MLNGTVNHDICDRFIYKLECCIHFIYYCLHNNRPKNSLSLVAKVPTAIRYHLTDPTIYKCGFEAINISPQEQEEYGDVIRRFKLYLKEDQSD